MLFGDETSIGVALALVRSQPQTPMDCVFEVGAGSLETTLAELELAASAAAASRPAPASATVATTAPSIPVISAVGEYTRTTIHAVGRIAWPDPQRRAARVGVRFRELSVRPAVVNRSLRFPAPPAVTATMAEVGSAERCTTSPPADDRAWDERAVDDPRPSTIVVHRALEQEAKPNRGHEILAQLEHEVGRATIMTVNIDRLHQRAGSFSLRESGQRLRSCRG